MYLSRIPSGMRYYVGAEARLRRAVEDTAMAVFDGWAYEEMLTPSVDFYSLFEQGMGHAEAHRAFRFTDADGQLLALRPDVTSSVARAAATLLAERPRPLRLCYAAPVFKQRQRSPAEWRRESTQLGCELIGAGGATADLEVLSIAAEILARLGLQGKYRITINSVEVFNGIAEGLGLDKASREQMRALIDTREARELQRFLRTYAVPEEEGKVFAQLTQLPGKREILSQARSVITNQRSVAALNDLEKLWAVIESLGFGDSFDIDLGDVSDLDYYTGLIFKVFIEGAGARVGRGGRYDRLIVNFGNGEPAIGFILDLQALTDVLTRDGGSLAIATTGEAAHIPAGEPGATFLAAQQQRAVGKRVKVQL
jgi:ATP phosphoribosyltransferase regulatory subunit